MKSSWRILFGLASVWFTLTAHADWKLDSATSALSFATAKNGAVVEAHRFTMLAGTVDATGNAMVTIGLESVETLVPVRDQRLRDMLFEVAKFPSATVSAAVPLSDLLHLRDAETRRLPFTGTLQLHGATGDLQGEVLVTRLSAKRFLIVSAKPLIVSAGTFGLDAGIENLRKAANLKEIVPAVPVSFSLTFFSE